MSCSYRQGAGVRISWILNLTTKLSQVIFLVLVMMCWGGRANAASSQYIVLEGGVQSGGAISGTVVFNGTAPDPEVFEVDTDESYCGLKAYSEELVVGSNGGIKNVVLSIENIDTGKAWDFPTKFIFDQNKCKFNPHVMIIKSKSEGVVLNSDDVVHNIHTISRGIFNINKSTNGHSEIRIKEKKIRKPGVIRVKCDMHYWMKGWWIVAKNPYTVSTNQDGEFLIEDVPAGSYNIKAWHEKLGESEYSVEVKADETAQLNVTLG
ncbi:MAG: carboxypeptidase regulatory-like domain-containing protein [Pseudomonadales bacterium]|nr:carboxypeptidase regulatory-like domain-containing protein [Pseudomonadales bacterium]